MKKFISEFKEFALKGNVLDLAVGVIIGASFQGLVKSLSTNIISPIIGFLPKKNFDLLQLEVFGIELKYGAFLTEFINFIIMAFVIFLIVKILNKLSNLGKKGEEAEVEVEKATKECPFCCTKISIKATRCPHCTSIIE